MAVEMKRYPLRGGTVTPKEAADHFGISIKSVYARLSKNGGSMDKLYDYYEARGVKECARHLWRLTPRPSRRRRSCWRS